MGLLNSGIKSRLETATELVKTSYHVAFIPFVIYMGKFNMFVQLRINDNVVVVLYLIIIW